MKLGFVVALGLVSRLALSASAVHAEPGIAITIYANDQALVQDTRTLNLKGGRQTLEFKGVSAKIRPETVSLTAGDLAIIEQNFDYDLLSPAKLMEKAVGHTVTLVEDGYGTRPEKREQVEVLSTNGGVLIRSGSHIEVLNDGGRSGRVIFDKIPDNLRASPTLSVVVDAKAGAQTGTLSYLTPGLGWKADYVALFDEATSKIDVQGWVTLTNTSGTTFDKAQTVLVAGKPSLVDGDGQDEEPQQRPFPPRGRPTLQHAGTESGTRARLGDLYLYPLPERTTIADQQTKQVSFLDVHGAAARHGYEYRLNWMQTIEQPVSAATVYEFSNAAKGGLGDQLPAGTVRFYLRDKAGAPQFIGEHAIGNTPMGSQLSISTGDAFDVKIKSTVEKREAISNTPWAWRTTMRYTLTNALPNAVTVSLIQDGLWGETHIIAESQKSLRRNADSAQWEVRVPANGTTTVTATFESKY